MPHWARSDTRAESRAPTSRQPVRGGETPAHDAVTALSGSGPAYVFLLVEAMAAAGAALGAANTIDGSYRRTISFAATDTLDFDATHFDVGGVALGRGEHLAVGGGARPTGRR